MSPKGSLDVLQKRRFFIPTGIRSPDCSARSSVAIPTELSELQLANIRDRNLRSGIDRLLSHTYTINSLPISFLDAA